MIETVGTGLALKWLGSPGGAFAGIDADTAAALVISASDVAVVVDAAGVVRDVAFGSAELEKDSYRAWIGRQWVDTVTVESRPKIDDLIRDSLAKTASRWRQVNHPAAQGPDVPVRYSTIRCGPDGQILAVGRDLRAMANLQRRLAEAQQAMEREYAAIRATEKRYRLLFQLASEPVLIVDAMNQRIVEVNPAASAMIGKDSKKLIGKSFDDLFDDASKQAVLSFVAALRVTARVDKVHARLAGASEALLMSGSLFRQETAAHFLVLLTPFGSEAAAASSEKTSLLSVVEKIPDAFVVTDMERRILTANSAFLDLIQVASEVEVRGELLDRWVGRPGIDMDVLGVNLEKHGVVRHFATILRGAYGSTDDVEIAAVAVPGGSQPCLGFTIRNAGWRAGSAKLPSRELPRTAEQFTDLVGRVPLKNLVRETTDMIERLCIEAALELTRDNRASAADMLGLSRQGLYAKLRRYGLGDLDGPSEEPN